MEKFTCYRNAGSTSEIKVLMIGPGQHIIGGITTLVETILPLLRNEVDIVYLPTVMDRSPKDSGKMSLKNIGLAILLYAQVVFWIWRFRPDIIHIHTSQGLAWLKDTIVVIICKILNRSIVVHIHAADFNELYGKRSLLVKYYTRMILRHTNAVIAVSDEWLKRLATIVPVQCVVTLRNCIATDQFSFPSVPGKETVALFLGSVGSRKGAFDLIEAIAMLKARGISLELWIVGFEECTGDLSRARARLEELGLGDTCRLTGPLRGKQKGELLAQANIFVLPSYNEGLPMAVLEAMGAGLAVVSTYVGGIPEVVKDGYNGFLIQAGDVAGLAERLAVLAGEVHLRETMGRRSREIAERELDVKPYVDDIVKLYKSLIHPAPPPL